jgi:hypothetical protein
MPDTAFEARRAALVVQGEQLEGLGFSLKPPKWLRKAQPGKVLKKIALPVAAIAATAFIPGAAPLALKAATGVARAAGSVLRAGGAAARVIGRGVARGATGAGKIVTDQLPRILPTPASSTPPILDAMTPLEQRRRQLVSRPIDRVRERQAAASAPSSTAATPAPATDFATDDAVQQPAYAASSDAAPAASGISPQLMLGGAALVVGALVLGRGNRR